MIMTEKEKQLEYLSKLPRTKEWRKKLSESNKGKIVSQETRDKMSRAKIGIKRSIETRRKIGLNGCHTGMLGEKAFRRN